MTQQVQMAQSRQICISQFNNKTQQEYLCHQGNLRHHQKVNCMNAGDIVLLYNNDTKKIFGIGVLYELSHGNIWIKSDHPYDQELYTGEDRKRNKYEIGAKTHIISEVSVNDIFIKCGLDKNTKFYTVGHTQYRQILPNIDLWVNRVLAELFIAEHNH